MAVTLSSVSYTHLDVYKRQATESAAVAVIYSLIVSVFIYKGLDWKGVWRVQMCIRASL